MDTTTTFAYEPIPLGAITSTDLRAELLAYLDADDLPPDPDPEGTRPIAAFRVWVHRPDGTRLAQPAEALVVEDRIGLAWGAPADWGYGLDRSGESPTGPNALEEAIDCWLNRGDEFAARN